MRSHEVGMSQRRLPGNCSRTGRFGRHLRWICLFVAAAFCLGSLYWPLSGPAPLPHTSLQGQRGPFQTERPSRPQEADAEGALQSQARAANDPHLLRVQEIPKHSTLQTIAAYKNAALELRSSLHSTASPNKTSSKCRLTVMVNTYDSKDYIEELVAYYIAHGASNVLVYDWSTHKKDVYGILENYIRSGRVSYSHVESTFSDEEHQQAITERARHFISRIRHGRPEWLLTVDDDEFVYPSGTYTSKTWKESPLKRRLLDFLCTEDVLAFPMVRFRWRRVGTSGITKKKRNELDIEAFQRMEGVDKNSFPKTGKSAYHVNHVNMSYKKWIYQDDGIGHKRRGGAFFLHGNNFKYTTRDFKTQRSTPQHPNCLEAGFTYHMTRALNTHERRNKDWETFKSRDREDRDRNDVQSSELSQWVEEVRLEKYKHRTKPSSRQDKLPNL
jgi:hypothetical protein